MPTSAQQRTALIAGHLSPQNTAVHAQFNYPVRDPSGQHPRTNKTGDDDPQKETMRTHTLTKPVLDAREITTSLESTGFTLVEHCTSVTNFESLDAVQEVYYKEIEALVQRHTGAERCILFDHTIRKVLQTDIQCYKYMPCRW